MDPRLQLPASLICPKVQCPMWADERSGMAVDQCTVCRRTFLDLFGGGA